MTFLNCYNNTGFDEQQLFKRTLKRNVISNLLTVGVAALSSVIGASILPSLMTAAGCGLSVFCSVGALSFAYALIPLILIEALFAWLDKELFHSKKITYVLASLTALGILALATFAASATLGQAFLPHFLAGLLGNLTLIGGVVALCLLFGMVAFMANSNQPVADSVEGHHVSPWQPVQ